MAGAWRRATRRWDSVRGVAWRVRLWEWRVARKNGLMKAVMLGRDVMNAEGEGEEDEDGR